MRIVAAGVHQTGALGSPAFFAGAVFFRGIFLHVVAVNVKTQRNRGTGAAGVQHCHAAGQFLHFIKKRLADAARLRCFNRLSDKLRVSA